MDDLPQETDSRPNTTHRPRAEADAPSASMALQRDDPCGVLSGRHRTGYCPERIATEPSATS